MMKTTINRNDDGTLPAFAWPGGYQMIYVIGDGGVICPDCANGGNGSNATTEASDCPDDLQWTIVGQDVHWEGEPIVCDHCSAEIESAYGPVDDEPTPVGCDQCEAMMIQGVFCHETGCPNA